MRYMLLTFVTLGLLTSCTSDPKAQSRNYVEKGNKYSARNKLKEASILYRRALQKDAKNPVAWYRLGLLDLKTGDVGEARGAFIRVTDLYEGGTTAGISHQDLGDAYTRTADIDYTGFLMAFQHKRQNQEKEFRNELRNVSRKLSQRAPGSFDAYRVAGLYDWTTALTPQIQRADDDRDAKTALQSALDHFLSADRLRSFDPSVGYAIVSTYFDTRQNDQAESYATRMIAAGKADSRVYDALWKYYFVTGRVDQAEGLRKKQTTANPKDAQAWLRLASHYAAAHRPADVKAALDKLTSDPKTFPTGHMLVGDFYFANSDMKAAVSQYEQGVSADPKNKSLYLKKSAEALNFQGKFDEASKHLAEVLKSNPNDAEAVAMNASLELNHAKPGDADKIIGQLQPLLAKTPGEKVDQLTVLHFNLGRAYALKGDSQSMDQARLQFQEVLNIRSAASRPPYIPAITALSEMELQRGENPAAVGHAEDILRVAPMNITAHLVRSYGLATMGEYDRARQELDALLKYNPKLNDAHFQLGRLDVMQKRYPEAEAEFAVLEKANDKRGFTGLLDSKVTQGRADEAMRMVQDALAKSPNNAGLENMLAMLEYNTGHYADAAAQYKQVLQQSPNAAAGDREVWYLRMGEALRRSGDLNGAITAFNDASTAAPKDIAPRLEIAMLFDATGRKGEARKAYEEILKDQPDNPIALNNLAYFDADNDRDLDKALSYAQLALKKSPHNVNISDTLGLIYFKKGLVEESSRLFSDLVNRAPNNATYHLHLAMALYKKGDKLQARRELEAASKNRPTAREQEQIKDLMSKIG